MCSRNPTELMVQAVTVIEASSSLASIENVVRAASLPLGYDRSVMFSVAPAKDEPVESILWVDGDWSSEGARVDAENYIRRCPVNRHVLETSEPFFWTKTFAPQGDKYRVVRTPKGPGLHGLQVPIFGRTGLEGAMSFGGENIDTSVAARIALTVIGITAFRAARRLGEVEENGRPTALSSREREVLRWTAAGRRQADIAATLGLSERTIENHLRRVRHRLGVTTTAQAVFVAIREGMIER